MDCRGVTPFSKGSLSSHRLRKRGGVTHEEANWIPAQVPPKMLFPDLYYFAEGLRLGNFYFAQCQENWIPSQVPPKRLFQTCTILLKAWDWGIFTLPGAKRISCQVASRFLTPYPPITSINVLILCAHDRWLTIVLVTNCYHICGWDFIITNNRNLCTFNP